MSQNFQPGATLLVFVCLLAGFGSQQPLTAQGTPAACGTVGGPFGEDRCLRLSFEGEVSSGEAFQERFGRLAFRLNPQSADHGWTIEVAPEDPPDANPREYVWVVNPPYRGWNTRHLDTSYGMTPSEALRVRARDFNFVLDEQQYQRAADLVEKAIMSRPLTDQRPREVIEKESQDAASALLSFPVAKGRLTILDSRLGSPTDKEARGSIEWLKFKVELRVPCDFSLGTDPAGISVDRTACAGRGPHGQN